MLHKTDGLSGLQQSTSQPVTHTPAALRILVFVIKVAIAMQVIGPGGHVNDKIEIGRISSMRGPIQLSAVHVAGLVGRRILGEHGRTPEPEEMWATPWMVSDLQAPNYT